MIFALDLRGLALFRCFLGAIICMKIFQLFPNLGLLMADDGVLPLTTLPEVTTPLWAVISVYSWFASHEAISFLAILYLLIAILFLLGWKTRIMTCLLWFMTISLNTRNPLILNGGDTVMEVFLFWGIFLPLGACFSLDACKFSSSSPSSTSSTIISFGSTCFILQIVCIYVLSGHAKSHSVWVMDFDALKYALMNESYVTALGKKLLNYPALLKSLTIATLYLEQLLILLLFSPYYPRLFRTIIPFTFILFHTGIALTLDVGLFSYACIAVWIALFPDTVYDRLFSFLPLSSKNKNNPILLPSAKIFAVSIPGIFIMTYLLLGSSIKKEKNSWAYKITAPIQALKLKQQWRLYAPNPSFSTRWFAIEITSQTGERFYLYPFQNQMVSSGSEEIIPQQYPVFYLRKYFYMLVRKNNPELYEAAFQGFFRYWHKDKKNNYSVIKLLCWKRAHYPELEEKFTHWTIYDTLHQSPQKQPSDQSEADDQEME